MNRMLKDPDVMRFLGGPLSYSENLVRESIVKRSGWMDSLYIVETIAESTSVGHAGILENTNIGESEFDFLIAFLPEHQRNGYGREVLELLRDRWMVEAGRAHCTASVRPENEASVKILVRCAFHRVGEYVDRYGFTRHTYRYENDAAT